MSPIVIAASALAALMPLSTDRHPTPVQSPCVHVVSVGEALPTVSVESREFIVAIDGLAEAAPVMTATRSSSNMAGRLVTFTMPRSVRADLVPAPVSSERHVAITRRATSGAPTAAARPCVVKISALGLR